MKFEWIKIEKDTLAGILDRFRPRIMHPDSPEYIPHWQENRYKCVNGIWVPQFGKMRYVPGRLGFFGVYGRIEQWGDDGTRLPGKAPNVRDLDWHRAYHTLVCDKFSGFRGDGKYTCDWAVPKKEIDLIRNEERYNSLFDSTGRLKKFIQPLEYLLELQEGDMGLPLYYNHAKNLCEAGTRGGGKSVYIGVGEVQYDICFDGEKTYTIGSKVNTVSSLEITSAGGGKSTELLQKAEFSMKCLADPEYPELGVWSNPGKPDYEPCPFWKFMSGSIAANNKENAWRNTDTGKDGGKWDKSAIGSGSVVYNTSYANNQVAGGLKSAGGRRTRVIHEEAGINVNLLSAWDSNEGLVTDSGIKMASQKAIGTSGDMTAVVPLQELFTHPKDRKCLVFEYPDEDADGEYGFFIPVYMVDEKFKDKDGNTDIDAAKLYHLKEYEDKASASDPNVFINHRMNYPIKIADMWVTGGTGLLPSTEAEIAEKKLMKGNMYQKIGTPVKLYNDSTKPYGVGYDVIQSGADPIYDFPFNPKRENFEGCVMMYINPDNLTINGIIPEDMCIITHDPYYNDEGGVSIGATHVWINPKYILQGKPGNCLAATYIGRHPDGTDGYNKILELLIAFYGNPIRSLWYEADKEKVRAFFLLKKKLNLLCLRPKYEQGSFLFDKQARYTGFLTGDAHTKRFLVQQFGEWLLKKTTLTGPDGELQELMNIERIPCIFTLRQIKLFTFDKSDNFDAISSAYAFPLALAEMEHYVVQENERKKNPMRSLQNLYIKKAFPNGTRNVRNNSFKRN